MYYFYFGRKKGEMERVVHSKKKSKEKNKKYVAQTKTVHQTTANQKQIFFSNQFSANENACFQWEWGTGGRKKCIWSKINVLK